MSNIESYKKTYKLLKRERDKVKKKSRLIEEEIVDKIVDYIKFFYGEEVKVIKSVNGKFLLYLLNIKTNQEGWDKVFKIAENVYDEFLGCVDIIEDIQPYMFMRDNP